MKMLQLMGEHIRKGTIKNVISREKTEVASEEKKNYGKPCKMIWLEGRGPTQTISDYAPLNKKKGDKNRHDDRLLRVFGHTGLDECMTQTIYTKIHAAKPTQQQQQGRSFF